MAKKRSRQSMDVIDYHYSRRLQMDMVGEGVLVGLVVGVIITLYRMSLSTAEVLLRRLLSLSAGNPLMMAGWMASLAFLAFVVSRLMQYEPDTRGSGIPQIDAEVTGRIDMRWPRVVVVKFIEGVICTFAGLSLGREGPSVQLGGMAGKGVSRALDKPQDEEHVLVTCGAAAGMSAAFHAPLTGVLFALEEIHREFNAPLVISVMASAAMADFVSAQVLGIEPVLHFDLVSDLPHIDYAFVLLMGIVCGLAGACLNKGMFFVQRQMGRLRTRIGDGVLFVSFLASGLSAFSFPQLLCGGDAILAFLEEGRGLSFALIAGLLLGKCILTSLCFGSGAPGGTLLPLVIMGALVGTLCGLAAIGASDVPLSYLNNFIVLGVAGLFAGSVRAPVTAVVLCFELTGTLETLLAATAVSLVSYVTANLANVEPFYEQLLGQLLAGIPDTTPDPRAAEAEGEKVLHTHVVGVGSIVEGKRVQDVPWPSDMLIVTINRAGSQFIPRGTTTLQALDEIVVIMDARQEADTELLMQDICRGLMRQRE